MRMLDFVGRIYEINLARQLQEEVLRPANPTMPSGSIYISTIELIILSYLRINTITA
jgi:hypothetical protein